MLYDMLIQKIILIGLFAKIKAIKLIESLVSVSPRSMMFSSNQKICENFENAKTYEDHVRFAQDFRWITIMIHSIYDSNFIQIR